MYCRTHLGDLISSLKIPSWLNGDPMKQKISAPSLNSETTALVKRAKWGEIIWHRQPWNKPQRITVGVIHFACEGDSPGSVREAGHRTQVWRPPSFLRPSLADTSLCYLTIAGRHCWPLTCLSPHMTPSSSKAENTFPYRHSVEYLARAGCPISDF